MLCYITCSFFRPFAKQSSFICTRSFSKRARMPWLRTNGVSTDVVAAEVINFVRFRNALVLTPICPFPDARPELGRLAGLAWGGRGAAGGGAAGLAWQ